MKTTKHHTQIPAESDNESDNEINTRNVMNITFENPPKSCKMSSLKAFGCAVSAIIFTVVTVIIILYCLNPSSLGGSMDKEDASKKMEELMGSNDSYSNFTDDEQKQYVEAFNVFDEDNDGYLNKTEFVNYFKIELNHSHAFDRIDFDKDNILSYKECATYIFSMDKIAEVHKHFLDTFVEPLKMLYNFDYINSSNELFLEYVTVFMYFEQFDSSLNGYILHDNYFNKAAESEFNALDQDKNNKISLDELGNILYGDNNSSWSTEIKKSFGDNYDQVMKELSNITLTQNMINNVANKLQLCPEKVIRDKQENEESKRRLSSGSYWYCCYKKYICVWDSYGNYVCYYDYWCEYRYCYTSSSCC